MRIESKVCRAEKDDQTIYNYITNFNNFKNLVPADKVQDWESGDDWCSFSVPPVGKTGIKVIDKEPHKLIKLTSTEQSQYDFTLWIQLKQVAENDTRMKLTMEAKLNPMMQVMAKKPLKEFLDKLVEKIAAHHFESAE